MGSATGPCFLKLNTRSGENLALLLGFWHSLDYWQQDPGAFLVVASLMQPILLYLLGLSRAFHFLQCSQRAPTSIAQTVPWSYPFWYIR